MVLAENIIVSYKLDSNDWNAASTLLPTLLEGAIRTVKIVHPRLTCIFVVSPSYLRLLRFDAIFNGLSYSLEGAV